MRKSIIISIMYPPTTPAFSHPSFPGRRGMEDTTDLLNSLLFLYKRPVIINSFDKYARTRKSERNPPPVSYTHLTLPTILRV